MTVVREQTPDGRYGTAKTPAGGSSNLVLAHPNSQPSIDLAYDMGEAAHFEMHGQGEEKSVDHPKGTALIRFKGMKTTLNSILRSAIIPSLMGRARPRRRTV
eukprot:7692900-Pyramimonas_sp.AAC.1